MSCLATDRDETAPPMLAGMSALAEGYDGYILDLWGVWWFRRRFARYRVGESSDTSDTSRAERTDEARELSSGTRSQRP